MPDTGIQMQLLIGVQKPSPAPPDLIKALLNAEIQNRDDSRDGFQLTFALERPKIPGDFILLRDRVLEPLSRVIIVVVIRGITYVLIDGIITRHQITPSNEPGKTQLVVTGEDISLKMDLVEKRKTYPNQPDSAIVTQLLGNYGQYGVSAQVTPTNNVPDKAQRTPVQNGTDLGYIHTLAQRNSFIFYSEPANNPGNSVAYWGPDKREGPAQTALTMNMGPYTNVESLNFSFDALLPSEPNVRVLDPQGRKVEDTAAPSGQRKALSRQPATAVRRTLPPGTAGLDSVQAGLLARANQTQGADAVTCNGELDAVRYNKVLRARRLVGVRGVGDTYDGEYYVKQVTHRISRGQYRQSFTLAREGRGALAKQVAI